MDLSSILKAKLHPSATLINIRVLEEDLILPPQHGFAYIDMAAPMLPSVLERKKKMGSHSLLGMGRTELNAGMHCWGEGPQIFGIDFQLLTVHH